MPSTTSSSFCNDLPSSTVITPSLPTFSIASAMIWPTSASEFAEIEPTWAISLAVEHGLDRLASASQVAITALSIPRFRSIGFMPAATYFMPSRTMDWARTVAVVVPSPAISEVFEATSFSICAPMFSNLSCSSISLATDTPSLVMVGAPKLRSSTTLRPFGPSVTLTALARVLTPTTMRSRAESPNLTSLAAMDLYSCLIQLRAGRRSALDHAHDVFFAHDEQFLAVDLDRLAGILAEQHAVACLDGHRTRSTVFQNLAVADSDHFALIRLLACGIGNHNATSGRTLGFRTLDDHTIMQGTDLHCFTPVRFKLRGPIARGNTLRMFASPGC